MNDANQTLDANVTSRTESRVHHNWLRKCCSYFTTTRVYGAPRVFDLFTLLAITLAFALLFALLGMLAPAVDATATDLVVMVGGFIVLIAIAQMWLFGSKNPRRASLFLGPIAFPIACFSFLRNSLLPMMASTIQATSFLSRIDAYAFEDPSVLFTLTAGLVLGLPFGPLAGYLAGAVIAGVFLLADRIRTTFKQTGLPTPRDSSFDELQ